MRSEDEHEQSDHHKQADEKDDTDHAAKELENSSHTILLHVCPRQDAGGTAPAPSAPLLK
jgi:hypothetical protein